jgi:hypothetical protein
MKQNHTYKVSDEELISEFNITPHLGKLSYKLNLPIITIWRRLKKLGLTCSTPKNSLKSIPLSEILDGKHPYYQTFKLNKRLIKEKILEDKCSICGIKEWNGKKINMHLDHINGISSDHVLSNLRLVCPNCHSQTETYCGKNI